MSFEQVVRQVLVHAAGAEIGGVKPRAAGSLVEHHQLLALLEAPERRRQRADIHRLRRDVQKMVQDTADLGIEHPDQAGAARHGRASQPLDRQAPGMFLVHRRDVVEPVEIGQVLQVGAAFHQLLGAAMQKPDMRVATLDHLAVKLQHEAKNTVRRRVLRAEVDVEVADALFARQGVVEAFGPVHHFASCFSSPGRMYCAPSQGDMKSNCR